MSELQSAVRRQDISNDVVLASLQTILQSKTFSHSASLRQALEFIVRNSLSSPLEPIKEYTLATEVLGRASDFDPKADNIVRVQMHRLREKLDEYYLKEGQKDLIRIVMPRGQYITEYVRNPADGQPITTIPPQPVNVSQGKGRRVDWRWAVGIVVVICSSVLVASHLRPSTNLPSSFRSVWEPFLLPNSPPLIVYANPAFLVSKQGDFHRYDLPSILSMPMGTRVPSLGSQEGRPVRGGEPGPFYYFDSYTGSGELVAAARIAQFLATHGEPFLIKRSRIVSYEDIKDQNVIFLGGIIEDQILRRLPSTQELVFEPPPPDQYPMGSHIRDLNPPPGHPAVYGLQLDPSTGAIQVDYGLISSLPSGSPGQSVMVLGGLTTLGSQAAGDFVTSEHYMALLERMRAAATATKPRSPFFQALLEVEVRDGVPLDFKCLLIREVNNPAH